MGFTTAEEAAQHQLSIHQAIEEGTSTYKGESWRAASLKEGYEFRHVLEHGLGQYAVNTSTGEVCEWQGKWYCEGQVLLCQNCFLDGT